MLKLLCTLTKFHDGLFVDSNITSFPYSGLKKHNVEEYSDPIYLTKISPELSQNSLNWDHMWEFYIVCYFSCINAM